MDSLFSGMELLGEAKVSCILRHGGVQLRLAYSWARPAILVAGKGRGGRFLFHRGVQLRLAYCWARPAILVAGKGRGGRFLFLLFLHFHSFSSFSPVPFFHLFCYLFYLSSPFLWETTDNDPQGLMCH